MPGVAGYSNGRFKNCKQCGGDGNDYPCTCPASPPPAEAKPTIEHLEALRGQYRQQATLAAEASADIALYEEKCRAARQRYEDAKTRRDSLKQQIAKHPLS